MMQNEIHLLRKLRLPEEIVFYHIFPYLFNVKYVKLNPLTYTLFKHKKSQMYDEYEICEMKEGKKHGRQWFATISALEIAHFKEDNLVKDFTYITGYTSEYTGFYFLRSESSENRLIRYNERGMINSIQFTIDNCPLLHIVFEVDYDVTIRAPNLIVTCSRKDICLQQLGFDQTLGILEGEQYTLANAMKFIRPIILNVMSRIGEEIF